MVSWGPRKRGRRRGGHRRVVAVTAGIMLVTAGAACSSDDGVPEAAERQVADYAKAWAGGSPEAFGKLTDDPDAARMVVGDLNEALGITETTVKRMGALTCAPEEGDAQAEGEEEPPCRQRLRVEHAFSGDQTWTYETDVRVVRRGEDWVVRWNEALVHPHLTPESRIRLVRELPGRASILDRDGNPLTEDRPVVRVKVDPTEATDATFAALRDHIGMDTTSIEEKVAEVDGQASGSADGLVHAVTVRDSVWANIAGHFTDIPGVVPEEGEMSLASSPRFARAVIGDLGLPDDAETVENAGSILGPDDEMGLSGLQRRYQQPLAGTPGYTVELYEVETGDTVEILLKTEPEPGTELPTTLDPLVQEAADAALDEVTVPAAVVAVKASTGEVLGVANGPGGSSFNRAFVGEYPPGSTFKPISAAALMERGLKNRSKVGCPETVNVGGKTFRNANGGSLPSGPFWRAFAASCNTTIVARADDLSNADLLQMAERFGIGAEWDVGLPAYSGQVPEPADLTDRAATMIGQSRVLMSPLGMAMVAATVASGQPRTPYLLSETEGEAVGEKLPDGLHSDLRGLMRAVVTEGSAKRLLEPVGDPVHAKTGTAEYVGEGGVIENHAWMIGFRGDLAFAVVLEGGGSGGKDAGPVAKRFLDRAPSIGT